MTYLEKAIDSLHIVNPFLFSGMYTPYSLDGYDPEEDALNLVIVGVGHGEQYFFDVAIQPCYIPFRGLSYYKIDVISIDGIRCTKIVPAIKVLDFLLHAKLLILADLEIILFEY
nr:hypothetical protein [uncultured Arsenicibacter sp.]